MDGEENFDLPEGMFEGEDFAQEAEIEDVPEYEVATLLPTGGNRVYLPIARDEDGGLVQSTITEAALQAGLTIPDGTQFWVEGVTVDPRSTFITPGMVITAIGNVKGG